MTISISPVRNGYLLGAGAAINVSVGFIPKRVDVFDITDGTALTIGFPGKLIPFNTGATTPPLPNSSAQAGYAPFKITGVTSGAIARIKDVILVSGTFAGGNAAGFFVADVEDITGTFGTENYTLSTSAAGAVDGACTVQVEDTVYQSAALGFVSGTGNTGILSYVGATAASKGFTIGSSIAVSGKRLRWTAFRD